jgi:hypothetical protein
MSDAQGSEGEGREFANPTFEWEKLNAEKDFPPAGD